MRLTKLQLEAIKETFLKHFEATDKLWLFGSRVDDNKRGGDIDLYIETTYKDTSLIATKQIKFLTDLQKKIGEQKIDVVINILSLNQSLHIFNEARKTGIQLI